MVIHLRPRLLLVAACVAILVSALPVLAADSAPMAADNPCVDVVPVPANVQAPAERQRLAQALLRMAIDCHGDDVRCQLVAVQMLLRVVQASNVACVGWWLDRKPGLLPEPDGTNTTLHVAAGQDDVAMVRYLLKRGARVDAKDSIGRTPAAIAAQMRHTEVERVLLAAGADPKEIELLVGPRDSDTPHEKSPNAELESAFYRDDVDAARHALDRGADLEAYGYASAPLCVAASANALRIAALLLERGAPVQGPCSLEPSRRNTPLHEASRGGRLAMVRLLLEHGARAELNASGRAPIDTADRDTARLLRDRDASLGDRWLLFAAPNLLLGADIGVNEQTRTRALVGLRPEFVFKRPWGVLGAGAYVEASSRWWHDAMLGGGLVLAPSTWIVPSVGVYGRHAADEGWTRGIAAGVFLGSHASNEAIPPERYGTYEPPPSVTLTTAENAGIRVELRWGTAPADRSIDVALQLDLDLLYLAPARVIAAIACCR
jgi:hypothetical protein